LVNDVNSEYPKELFQELLSLTSKKKIIQLDNKIDLISKSKSKDVLSISTKTGEGFDGFIKTLKEKSISENSFSEKSAIVSTLRHKTALKKSEYHLKKSIESIDNKLSGEFISVDLRIAENSLAEIIGEVTSEDILNNIFSRFCIGK